MNRIKELRIAKGLRQIDLAEKLGVLQSTISHWENGKVEPDMDFLMKIASLFDTTIDCVVGGAISPPPQTSSGTWIPVLGEVAAGVPIEAVENIIDWEEISAKLSSTGKFFGLRIKGSSMEPRMREGDVVIVRKQDDAETGDTVVVLVNGDSATVKKIKKGPDGMQLIPTNPAYDPIYYTAADIAALPVRIIGRVVELRAKY